MENAPLVSESNKAAVIKSRSVPALKMPAREPTLPAKLLAAGTAACIADLITFPLDTAKVRLQIQGEGSSASSTGSTTTGQHMLGRTAAAAAAAKPAKYRGVIGTVCTISRQEGPRALYNGLIPGLQRQMCFASVRIGLYDTVKEGYGNLFGQNQGQVGVGVRILAGITTGGMAVLCAQPTDVVKVRFQCQPAGVPRRYNGVMAAYRTIAVEEGVRGLWKGTSPNVARNCIVNAAELVSYDLIKQKILSMGLLSDNLPCHFVSAFGAGFCTTVVASPVDVIKTRFMNSGAGTYSGVVNCAQTMYKNEGAKAFYKGFMPSFMRLASWNVVMFVCYEQLKRAFSETPKIPAIEIERQTKRFA